MTRTERWRDYKSGMEGMIKEGVGEGTLHMRKCPLGVCKRNLGSPKAMRRMTSYLYNVKPKSVELVVDEMFAICSEIGVWREKKARN